MTKKCVHKWKNTYETVDCGSYKQMLHGLVCEKCGETPTNEEYNDEIDRVMENGLNNIF